RSGGGPDLSDRTGRAGEVQDAGRAKPSPLSAAIDGVVKRLDAARDKWNQLNAPTPGLKQKLAESRIAAEPADGEYVPISQEDSGFTYHSTDRIENLEGILRDGLRPGHASNVSGQGIDNPYVLVYEGKQSGLTPV